MHDSYTRSQRVGGRLSVRDIHTAATTDKAAEIAGPEAHLLDVLHRALVDHGSQRIGTEPASHLVNRIETILGKRLEAANDIDSRTVELAVMPPQPERDKTDGAAPPPTVPTVEEPSQPKLRAGAKSLAVVGLMCVLGAAGGALIPNGPVRYTASGVLAVDGGADVRAALTKTTERKFWSSRTIATAVSALKLDHDSEFAGSSSDALKVAVDLLSVSDAATDPASRAESSLVAAIRTASDDRTGTIDFSVTSSNPEKSVRIATYLASIIAPSAISIHDDGPLKAANDEAQSELASFMQRSGEGNVKVAAGLQRQIGDIAGQLKAVEERILGAKEKADRLKAAKVADALTGTLSPDMMSPVLIDRRDRYAVAKASLAQLSANLGPRHPRLLAQQAEVDGLRNGIDDELGRLLREANDEAKQATAEKRQLNDNRNTLIAQSRDTGVDVAKLTELRDKANATRSRFEDAISTGALPPEAGHVGLRKAPEVAAVSAGGFWWAPLLGAIVGLVFGLGATAARSKYRTAGAEKQEPFLQPSVTELLPDARPPVAPVEEPDEMKAIRAEIAAMRGRLRSYAVAS
ncbi:hypothetical protein [Rhizobium sp. Root1220]|uniref:hypothetical protein n=1 Tax=Rhizobium sp. Root1220 TaxID=1736432 RepID=UPI0006FE43C0|nr:hypothetical protein [Rhizobium sp. Root1220]KQV68344.1 succinoglycan biosynthesis protein [Rhizobium sp. Root1220]